MYLLKTPVITCLIAVLASPLCLPAQTATHASREAKLVHAILQAQEEKKHAAYSAAKTASVAAERLIAVSAYDYYPSDSIMGLSDTANYYYSNGRGSMFNYNSLSFNSSWLYGFYDYGYGRALNTLASDIVTAARPNYFAQTLCDSSHEYGYSSGDTSGHHYIAADTVFTYETYNGANNLTLFSGYQGSVSHFGAAFAWDSYGNNTESVYLQYSSFSDTQGMDIHIFNSAGQLAEDSILYWGGSALRPENRIFYTYDGAGNLVHVSSLGDSLGTWLEYDRWDMTYNADNFIKTDSFSLRLIGTGTWVGDHSDSTGYTAGIGYYTFQRIVAYNDSTYSTADGLQEYAKHVNSAGLPDTLYFSSTGVLFTNPPLFVPEYKLAFVYDAYGNPATSYQFFYHVTDTTTGAGYYDVTPDITRHYYYETYQSSASVNNVARGAKITIFPNPSAGLYNVVVSSGLNRAKAIVYNQMGQKVYENYFTGANMQVDLAAQPNGLYFAQITDESGAILKTEKLVKIE